MNRHEFSVAYAKNAGITQEVSEKTCGEIFDFLYDCICKNDRVYIQGLGTFTNATKKSHSPSSLDGGESITIPERGAIKFLPYQSSASVPHDPMADVVSNADDSNSISQMVSDAVKKLGVLEFMKRLSAVSVAKPYEVDMICKRSLMRVEKAVCPYCGKEFVPRFAHQKFCCGQHREANYRRARTDFSAYEHDHKPTGKKKATATT